MELNEAIEYEETIGSMEVADWLKVLKDIQSTGCCNECYNKGTCKYEPEAGQMARYNCPFFNDESITKREMTYKDIYDEFRKKFPGTEVNDYRPAWSTYLPQLVKPIQCAIIVWLKDGSKVVYIAESEELQ